MPQILMPIKIKCEEHDKLLEGDYDELNHCFHVELCEDCRDSAQKEGYDDGYDDAKTDLEEEDEDATSNQSGA